MTIKEQGNILNIEGNIKSIEDFEQIKTAVDGVLNVYDSIILNIKDSISLISSVIGYLMKLTKNEDKRIYVNVGSDDLYNLLDELNLVNEFFLKKI